MRHTHYYYEVVLTADMRREELPYDHPDQHGGWPNFVTGALRHDHDIDTDHRDGVYHTHPPVPLPPETDPEVRPPGG